MVIAMVIVTVTVIVKMIITVKIVLLAVIAGQGTMRACELPR